MEYKLSKYCSYLYNEDIKIIKCGSTSLYPWDERYKLSLLLLFEHEDIPIEVVKTVPISALLEFVLFEYKSDYWAKMALQFIKKNRDNLLIDEATYLKISMIRNDKFFSQEVRHGISNLLGRIW